MKFRHTNFMRLIYATLLALPFVAILSRVIYVQSNKNAYQSYTETTYKTIEPIYYASNEVTTYQDIFADNIYYYADNIESGFQNIGYWEIFIDVDLYLSQYPSNHPISNVRLYNNTNQSVYIQITFSDDTPNSFLNFSSRPLYLIPIKFTNKANITTDIARKIQKTDFQYIKEYVEVEQEGTLDNVFEYSVNKFIENNNFGKINLFQWTTDLFFDSNDVNNMYVGFINWYLNYTLLVSATYILFLVLMWFINYARRLLERGMNYDW